MTLTRKVVIDEDIHGWSEENHDMLKPYHTIIKVGDNPESLKRGSPDEVVADYCNTNGCDLFTSDVGFYTDCIKVGIKTIQITNCGFWEKGQKQIFLVKIIESLA
ncbi:hypothetical protein [Candidatus Nitrosarchaeum limnium]|jgi:rRNA-processing protein FCF1|uniref:hypothetical protein n=1 Tax=Candidatus Nitrosarchaeum limnium TaxID=1007084 RepID=UPI00106271E2|nr:hypothetical protein [Candidatus Nitrosarchaeum limnium]